jgi:hypothetical protein
MKMKQFFLDILSGFMSFIRMVCAAVLLICLICLLLVILIFPAIRDTLWFSRWYLSTKKARRRWYRKSLRSHISAEMHRFRFGWYDLYVTSSGSWTETRGDPPRYPGFFRARPGNAYWRAHVRGQMRYFRRTFSEPSVAHAVGAVMAFAGL